MKNCPNNDYTIKRIEIESNFADDVFKKYRYKRYGIGNCCGSDFDDNINKKALCDYDDNQLTTYIDSTIKSVIYTPPEGGAEDDPNKPDWVNALCGMDNDEVQIYFYYDATSLGVQETIAAYTAAQAWVDNITQDSTEAEYVNCTNIEENTLNAYHTTVFGERWLDWGTSALTGLFNNSGSCGGNGTTDLGGGGCVTGTVVNVDPGGPSRNFGINDCGSAADSAFPATVNANSKFWGALQWAQSNGKIMYNGGAAGVNGGAFFPTVNTLGIAPQATAKNILVVCFIDESASPTHHQPYTDKQNSGPSATWNAATDGTGTVTPCWAADHTEFITQRNLYLSQGPEYDANFYCYPSHPASPGGAHIPFPLHSLGAITSGDKGLGSLGLIRVLNNPANGSSITLTSTDGTVKTYTAGITTDTTTNTFISTGTVTQVAAALKVCIESIDGHNGKILVTPQNIGELVVEQSVVGPLGDVVITSTTANITVLGFTGGIVNDGTLTVAPPNSLTSLVAITTSNPYFAQGYGELDQHGWGINPAEDPFTREGFDDDLNEYAEIIQCNDSTCFVFRVVNQDGTPIPCYNIILDGGNIGYTDDYGVLRYCIINASVNTHHTLQLCHCFETTGNCSSQDVTITLTEECPVDACPKEPFIACEDTQVDPSGNELSGCLDPLSPNYCPDCTSDCAGVVGGSDWSCCDYCTDFYLSFSSTDATDMSTDDGTIDLTVSNGTPPYTYAWTGPNGFTATTEDLTGLAGGVYVVVVTDSSDPECTETLTVYIEQPPDIVFGCMDAGTLCDEGMDVAFVIDYTSSMGTKIDQVKTGVASIISQIQGMVGSSDYKLSLSIADEYNPGAAPTTPPYLAMVDYTGLPAAQRDVDTTSGIASGGGVAGTRHYYRTAMEMFGLNNGATFTTQLNKLNQPVTFPLGNAGTHNFPEATDLLVDMVGLQDFTGTWRTGVAKYIIVMTDALPAGNDDWYDATDTATLGTLATNLLADDIKVIVVGYGTSLQFPAGYYPWRELANATDGTWDTASVDYSTATNSALSTLCDGSTAAACNYDPLATYDCAGVLGGTDYSCCFYDACTDATATNFDNTGTHDCNCEPIGTFNPGWNSCCLYCIYGCMDPLANNYDPLATCEDACTYDWLCTEGSATNSCENMIDTNCYCYDDGQLAKIALASNGYQYTDVFTLQFEIPQSPLSDRCPGPNGGSMAYLTSFGMNTPSNWNMNAAGYTTWNDFITDLSALAFPTIDLTTAYSTVEAYMANGYEGNTYTMEIEWDFCICTDGNITTLNSCAELGYIDVTSGNPADTSTPADWSQYLSVTYPNQPANELYFCSTYQYATLNNNSTNLCPCGDDGAGGTNGFYTTIFTHSYNDGAGGVVPGTIDQTWNGFIDDLIILNVPGIFAGMDYLTLLGLPQGIQSYFGMAWSNCTCTEVAGCTCVEMTDGTGIYANFTLCEDDVNCCGNICGCMDPAASNYDATATQDCKCQFPPVGGYGDISCCIYPGCMDPLAINYDPQATVDDGSCEYMWKCEEGGIISDSCSAFSSSINGISLVGIPAFACYDLYEIIVDDPTLHNTDIDDFKFEYTPSSAPANGCLTNQTVGGYWYQAAWLGLVNYNTWTTHAEENWADMVAWGDINLAGWNVDLTMTYAQVQTALNLYNVAEGTDWAFHCNNAPCICSQGECDCVQDPAGTFNNELECQQFTENCCDQCGPCKQATWEIPGCCDPTADNYDPLANCDDGSCTYTGIFGCMDCGYIWEAMNPTLPYCNGTTPATTPGGMNFSLVATSNNPTGCIYFGCTDPLAANYHWDCNNYDMSTGNNPVGDPYSGHTFITDGCCEAVQNNMTYIPDPNFQAWLTNISQVSGWWDSTGTVSGGDWCFTNEIDTMTFLSLLNQGVDNLTGLQDFVSLHTFHGGNTVPGGPNTFTTVNPFIDTLVNLTTFGVPGTLITSVDFSGNPALQYVQLQNCLLSGSSSVDVTNNPVLVELNCSFNSITGIDIGQNPLLESFNFYSNQLTSVDVTNNPVLDYLGVTTNLLTSLDVSQNVVLDNLQCADNQLTTLDVSTNTWLTKFNCSTNQLTTLDVTQNTILSIFHAFNNQLTSLDISNGNNVMGMTPVNFRVSINSLVTITCDNAGWATVNYTFAAGCIDNGVTYV